MKLIIQKHENDCGLACCAMIHNHYSHRNLAVEELFDGILPPSHEGFSLADLETLFRNLGYNTEGLEGSKDEIKDFLLTEFKHPVIAHTKNKEGNGHFVVLNPTEKNIDVFDPAYGTILDMNSYAFSGVILTVLPNNDFNCSIENTKHSILPFVKTLFIEKKLKSKTILVVFLAALTSFLSVLLSNILGEFMDFLTLNDKHIVAAYLLILLMLYIFNTIVCNIGEKQYSLLQGTYSQYVLENFLSKLEQTTEYIEKRKPGDIITRITEDIEVISNNCCTITKTLSETVAIFFLTAVLLVLKSKVFAILLFIIVIAEALIIFRYRLNTSINNTKSVLEKYTVLQNVLYQELGIKNSFENTKRAFSQWNLIDTPKLQAYEIDTATIEGLFSIVLTISVLGVSSLLYFKTILSIGEVMTIVMLTNLLQGLFEDYLQLTKMAYQTKVSIQRIKEI